MKVFANVLFAVVARVSVCGRPRLHFSSSGSDSSDVCPKGVNRVGEVVLPFTTYCPVDQTIVFQCGDGTGGYKLGGEHWAGSSWEVRHYDLSDPMHSMSGILPVGIRCKADQPTEAGPGGEDKDTVVTDMTGYQPAHSNSISSNPTNDWVAEPFLRIDGSHTCCGGEAVSIHESHSSSSDAVRKCMGTTLSFSCMYPEPTTTTTTTTMPSSTVPQLPKKYHLGTKGAVTCDYGENVGKDECLQRGLQVVAANGGVSQRQNLQEDTSGTPPSQCGGGWGDVPAGCSVYSSDGAVHWKEGPTSTEGCPTNEFRLVCAQTPYHVAPRAAVNCDYGKPVPKNDCLEAGKYLAVHVLGHTLVRTGLVEATDGSGANCGGGGFGDVMAGCSLYAAGDWATHWKEGGPTQPQCPTRNFQMICTEADPPPVALSGRYSMVQKKDRRYMDAYLANGEGKDFGVVTRESPQSDNSQYWVFTKVADGEDAQSAIFTIQQLINMQYLDAHESNDPRAADQQFFGTTFDYQAVTRSSQAGTSSADTQLWVVTATAEPNVFTFQQKSSQRYLDAYTSGNKYKVVTRGGDQQSDGSQHWILTSV